MKNFDVPGTAISLIQDGKVIYARGFGMRNTETREPFTLDTVYRIGSTSKSYTSMLAAMMWMRGGLTGTQPCIPFAAIFSCPMLGSAKLCRFSN